MTTKTPTTELDERYGDDDTATPWADAEQVLAASDGPAHLTTLRPDGRPHVTPLLVVWHDGAAHFCTGPEEQKARHLAGRADVVVTVRSAPERHLDVVVDGLAERVTDDALLARLAARWTEVHGDEWHFEARDGVFHHTEQEGVAHVFAVRPRTAWGFSTAAPFSQTRWTF